MYYVFVYLLVHKLLKHVGETSKWENTAEFHPPKIVCARSKWDFSSWNSNFFVVFPSHERHCVVTSKVKQHGRNTWSRNFSRFIWRFRSINSNHLSKRAQLHMHHEIVIYSFHVMFLRIEMQLVGRDNGRWHWRCPTRQSEQQKMSNNRLRYPRVQLL